MRLLLVYSDWGEMDMGWGQGHLDLSFTAETVNSRILRGRNWGEGTSVWQSVNHCSKSNASFSQHGRGQASRGEERNPVCYDTKLGRTTFGAWIIMWLLSLHPFLPLLQIQQKVTAVSVVVLPSL